MRFAQYSTELICILINAFVTHHLNWQKDTVPIFTP